MKNHLEAAVVFNTHAELYEQKYMDVSRYKKGIEIFLEMVPQNGAILDLACGPGNLMNLVHELRPDLTLTGIDLAPKMIDLAKKNLPTANFKVLNTLDIDQLNSKFDGITCGLLLPYLSKEECNQQFQKCVSSMNSNAPIYISCIEGQHSTSGRNQGSTKDSLYQYYYEQSDLEQLLTPIGFKVQESRALNYIDEHGEEVFELEVLARIASNVQ